MNDTLIALGAACAALVPLGWVLRHRWTRIRPLRHEEVLWDIDTTNASTLLSTRYAVHAAEMAQDWSNQLHSLGNAWLRRATTAQIEQLHDNGWGAELGTVQVLTRAQAQDLLMLARTAEENDIELLDFFNLHVEQPNAWAVSSKADALRADMPRMDEWHNRPATALQKEALRYFDSKIPRSLTAKDAKDMLRVIENGLHQSGRSSQWNEWLLFSQTWLHLQSKDICTQYDIKKPAPTKIREAILSLMEEQIPEWNEHDVVVQRLVELYPDLELR